MRTTEARFHVVQHDFNFRTQPQLDILQKSYNDATTKIFSTFLSAFIIARIGSKLPLTGQQFNLHQQHTTGTDELLASTTQHLHRTQLFTSNPPHREFQVSSQQPIIYKKNSVPSNLRTHFFKLKIHCPLNNPPSFFFFKKQYRNF